MLHMPISILREIHLPLEIDSIDFSAVNEKIQQQHKQVQNNRSLKALVHLLFELFLVY